MRRAVAVAVALLAAGCGAGAATTTAGDGALATWTSDVRRLAVDHPADWWVAPSRVAPSGGPAHEVLTVATFEAPTSDTRCNPVPLAALEVMGPDDVLVVLGELPPGWSYDEGLPPPGIHEVEDPPGCPPPTLDVRAWERDVVDEPTGRRFRAYVAAGADAAQSAVAQAWAVVDSIRAEPLPGPHDDVAVGDTVPHFLYTHCGIRSTTFDGREWLADPPVDDGEGNPPAGWDDPPGLGTMTLEAEDRAVYRTGAGQSVAFRPRTPADPQEPPCA